MNKFHNMSCPPRSEMVIKVSQLDKLIAFDPCKLFEILNSNANDITNAINKYIDNNPDYYIKAPKTYMFALTSDNKTLDYDYCVDLDLLICVFSKTIGNIYIPNRVPNFGLEKFNRILFFNERELYDFN